MLLTHDDEVILSLLPSTPENIMLYHISVHNYDNQPQRAINRKAKQCQLNVQ